MTIDNKLTSKNIQKTKHNFLILLLTHKASSIIVAIVLALAFTWITIDIMKADPLGVFRVIIKGAFGSTDNLTQVIQTWVPLVLASCGLMFTFTSGLWNIGMEGQITMGAVFGYAVIRFFTGSEIPSGLVIILSILGGMVGGLIWALFVGALKNFGGVNEIFGGLGFNFIADAILLSLVYGPWKPEGVASGSTKLIERIYWLPQMKDSYLSLWALGIAIIGILFVTIVLQGTYFGLKLKAVGKNMRSAFLLGIPTNRYMMLSFALCGLFAGTVGALQVNSFQHVLKFGISGGYGYLGLMVGMLANIQPLLAVPIAFVFIALSKGATGLGIDLKLDSNLSGVIQGSLVIFVLMMNGIRKLLITKKKGI